LPSNARNASLESAKAYPTLWIAAAGTTASRIPPVERHDLQRAGPDLLQHRGVAAELVVREDGDIDAAVGLFAHGVPEVVHCNSERMVDWLIRPSLAAEFGGGGRRTHDGDPTRASLPSS